MNIEQNQQIDPCRIALRTKGTPTFINPSMACPGKSLTYLRIFSPVAYLENYHSANALKQTNIPISYMI